MEAHAHARPNQIAVEMACVRKERIVSALIAPVQLARPAQKAHAEKSAVGEVAEAVLIIPDLLYFAGMEVAIQLKIAAPAMIASVL
jgi:hypothetical protein